MNWLRDLFRGKAPAPSFDAPILPDAPLAVIGDVHGCDDLLSSLLDRLAKEHPQRQIVLVGDYVDRGEASASVVRRLMDRPDLVCLKGNHEAMCLSFLDNPAERGTRWLRNGGLQTLSSFGIGGVGQGGDAARLTDARDRLALAMGDEMIDWIRARPAWWQSGNVAVVHAGADPDLPPSGQDEKVLYWGHPRFATQPRTDGRWIVHGHTIVDEPVTEAGRIATDTGAYATGRLTAALIDPDRIDFLST